MGPKAFRETSPEDAIDNKAKWEAYVQDWKKQTPDNESQRKVIESASRMRSNMVAVNGPPGAGKTSTISDLTLGLVNIEHTVLICAKQNTAVDNIATAVNDALVSAGRTDWKSLRIEVDSMEKASVLSKKNYADYEGYSPEELAKSPEYRDLSKAAEHLAIRNALSKIATNYAKYANRMEKITRQLDSVEEAFEQIQKNAARRKPSCPTAMTLDYRIWEIVQRDKLNAGEFYQEILAKTDPSEHHTVNIDGFDRSAAYRAAMANYLTKGGHITNAEKKQFEKESDRMYSRVLSETKIPFTTTSNAGGSRVSNQDDFQPTVIICDEAGQVTIPGLAVPLTTFNQWEGLFLFGDIQQLEPTILSSAFNEFSEQAKYSPLLLLYLKRFPMMLLDLQYRMSPAIAQFVSEQFYEGKLPRQHHSGHDFPVLSGARTPASATPAPVQPPTEPTAEEENILAEGSDGGSDFSDSEVSVERGRIEFCKQTEGEEDEKDELMDSGDDAPVGCKIPSRK